jgi:GNAT superfamily N-acetyltransferase
MIHSETKNGQTLRFELNTDPEDYLEDHYGLHEIKAFVGDEEVGYIKAVWLKPEPFEVGGKFESVLKFAAYFRNEHRIKKYVETGSLQESMSGISCSYLGWSTHCDVDWENESDEVLQEYFEKAYERILEKHNRDFEQTKSRVQKPIVDYINVEDEWQRQGIGTALYEAMARHLGEMNMMLFASQVQSDAAAAVWERNKEVFPTVEQQEQTYYDETITRTAIDFR